MRHVPQPVLPLLLYGTLALTLLVSAQLAGRHRRAYLIGIGTVGVLWVLVAFNVLLLSFGWYYLPRVVVGTTARVRLLRADRRWGRRPGQAGARNAVNASAYIT